MSAIVATKPSRNPPAARRLRVLICAASSRERARLEQLLAQQTTVKLVAIVPRAGGLLHAIAESDPDVVVLHLENPSAEIRWENLLAQGIPVVLLAESISPFEIPAVVAGGGLAILSGDVTEDEVAAAVVSAAAGLLTLSSDLAHLVRQSLAGHFAEDDGSGPLDSGLEADAYREHLTAREREVLEMMTDGLSNKEIAARLNLSVHTVKFHISSILGKLRAASRTEAAAIGLRRGLITI